MGVLLDVVISHIVNAGHVFVQQPTNPVFIAWQSLNECMKQCYADGSEVPPLPTNVEGECHLMAYASSRFNAFYLCGYLELYLTCPLICGGR